MRKSTDFFQMPVGGVKLTRSDYETSKIHADHRAKLIEWKAGSVFENRLFRFSPPTRFGALHWPLESSKNVFCFLDANLVALKELGKGCFGNVS